MEAILGSILVGPLVAIATQVLKKLTDWIMEKLNVDAAIAGNITLLLVFGLCFAGVLVYNALQHAFGPLLLQVGSAFGVALAVYEVVLKNLPVVGKRDL